MYLNEQLGVFLKVKQQKLSSLKRKKVISKQNVIFLHNVIFYQVLKLLKFLKISYVLLEAGHIPADFLKAVFHKIYLVHS